MSRLFLGLLAAALIAAEPAAAPSVRDVMKKLNRGPTSVHSTLLLDLKDDDPDWEAIQENTAEYAKQTAFLLKNKPAKGDAGSWETLAKSYSADARALDAAAKRKDARGTSNVLKRMSNSCMACHKAHKPE